MLNCRRKKRFRVPAAQPRATSAQTSPHPALGGKISCKRKLAIPTWVGGTNRMIGNTRIVVNGLIIVSSEMTDHADWFRGTSSENRIERGGQRIRQGDCGDYGGDGSIRRRHTGGRSRGRFVGRRYAPGERGRGRWGEKRHRRRNRGRPR